MQVNFMRRGLFPLLVRLVRTKPVSSQWYLAVYSLRNIFSWHIYSSQMLQDPVGMYFTLL
jgi:hypothetical protein